MAKLCDHATESLYATATSLAQTKVRRIVVCGGGGNSRLFRVDTDQARYALKSYPPSDNDRRDRAGVEFAALRFLRDHGIAAVPEPFAVDVQGGYLLAEWIDGAPVHKVGAAHIDQAIDFVRSVADLRRVDSVRTLPDASEACMSGGEILRQVNARAERLLAVAGSDGMMRGFIEDEWYPTLREFRARAEEQYVSRGWSFFEKLEHNFCVPIAADFGFHNVLQCENGSLIFFDFEYFGLDDPVKLTADFLMHPAVSIDEPLKRRFHEGMVASFGQDQRFAHRLQILFGLFGLRWCMILLNEFDPERWVTRRHAQTADLQRVKARQMKRAQRMLSLLQKAQGGVTYAC